MFDPAEHMPEKTIKYRAWIPNNRDEIGAFLDATLDRAKAWLIGNNTAVMAVLFVVFGVNLVGDAIQILT